MLFSQYANEWFSEISDKQAFNTQRIYRNILENHLLPSLKDKDLEQITITDIQKIIDERKEHPATCKHILMTWKKLCWSKELVEGISTVNYKAKKQRRLTELEIEGLKKITFTKEQQTMLYLLYGCGLRKGELLALEDSDFDFAHNEIHITKAIRYENGYPVMGSTQTKHGPRVIPIPYCFVKRISFYVEKHPILFINEDGNYLTQYQYNTFWSTIVDAFHLYTKESLDLTAYTFRYHYLCQLFYADISVRQASELLGHVDYQRILKIYDQLHTNNKEELEEKINRAFPTI